jgi:sulfur-carrier protein adenylyltransferase/sulfurtransferase
MNVVLFPQMLAKVAKLPTSRLEADGQTLREVIGHLCMRHADLRAHLFYENGNFKEHFLFTSAGELVDPDSELPAGSEIDIMLATSGGTGSDQLSNDEVRRYVRHITLPEVGRAGQLRLKNAKVLIIGTGGLGSPVSLYLAAAGVGTLGLIDFDVVESSNLQRQVVHGISTLGMPKVESAKRRLQDLNETITINTYNAALDSENALSLIGQYDLVVDGTDNFSTRYLVNDACARLKKPLVYGAIYRFDGQMSVFNHGDGPCYRCLFPNSPPPELAQNCSAGGVIGVLPGVVGLIQATEAIKLILRIGEPLVGRLMRFDAKAMKFSEVRFKRRADCRACSPLYADAPLSQNEFVCSNSAPAQPPLPADFFIKPLELQQIMERGGDCVLVDVRDANELEVCKLPCIVNIPLIELEDRLGELNRDLPHYLVCYGGMRAERAANTLLSAGFAHVQVLQGGMKHWVRDVEPDMPIY